MYLKYVKYNIRFLNNGQKLSPFISFQIFWLLSYHLFNRVSLRPFSYHLFLLVCLIWRGQLFFRQLFQVLRLSLYRRAFQHHLFWQELFRLPLIQLRVQHLLISFQARHLQLPIFWVGVPYFPLPFSLQQQAQQLPLLLPFLEQHLMQVAVH